MAKTNLHMRNQILEGAKKTKKQNKDIHTGRAENLNLTQNKNVIPGFSRSWTIKLKSLLKEFIPFSHIQSLSKVSLTISQINVHSSPAFVGTPNYIISSNTSQAQKQCATTRVWSKKNRKLYNPITSWSNSIYEHLSHTKKKTKIYIYFPVLTWVLNEAQRQSP